MITREELILIGHYNKPHGVNGEISATLDIDSEALQGLSCLVSDMNGIFVPFYVDACRPKNHETVLLMIDGMDTEQEVTRLVANVVEILGVAEQIVVRGLLLANRNRTGQRNPLTAFEFAGRDAHHDLISDLHVDRYIRVFIYSYDHDSTFFLLIDHAPRISANTTKGIIAISPWGKGPNTMYLLISGLFAFMNS